MKKFSLVFEKRRLSWWWWPLWSIAVEQASAKAKLATSSTRAVKSGRCRFLSAIHTIRSKTDGMNVFRILGDVSHTASKCILIWAIHSNRSAEGIHLPSCLMNSADDRSFRCVIDYPGALRWCLHHTIPRSLLDSTFQLHMELHPENFLHPLFPLHHLSHDESLCPNAGKRKGVEIRGILLGGISALGAHCQCYCPGGNLRVC